MQPSTPAAPPSAIASAEVLPVTVGTIELLHFRVAQLEEANFTLRVAACQADLEALNVQLRTATARRVARLGMLREQYQLQDADSVDLESGVITRGPRA